MNRLREIPFINDAPRRQIESLRGGLRARRVDDQAMPADRLDWHRHPYFEIFWIHHGTGEHLNDFQCHPFTGGTLIFVSIGQAHTWRHWRDVGGYMMTFSPEDLGESATHPGLLTEFPFFFGLAAEPTLLVPPAEWAEFDRLFEAAVLELESSDALALDAARALLRLILIRSQRIFGMAGGHPLDWSAPARLARRFLLELERHFLSVRQVRNYAARLEVTPNHLIETVRQRLGKTPGEVIEERLYLEAKRLLFHTTKSISEIAYQLEFKSPSHFGRLFKRHAGFSPGEAREQFTQEMSTREAPSLPPTVGNLSPLTVEC